MTGSADFPAKLEFLFRPARYKVLYGGRGGSKSWGIARALLIIGAQRKLRILCARETMNSIADSVHKLLSDQIESMGLSGHYTIQKANIIGRNGTEFAFAGLRHNVAQIKSYESFNVAWVEEAHNVSKASWEILIPTIRTENSEIWVSFNPELETDDTYRRFVMSAPPGAVVVKLNWRDNPWFPDVLRTEMEHLKATDPDAYNHVWEGCCIQNVEGAIYAAELRKADAEGRITRVPYDPLRPVHTFWDLGYGDATCIWFAQAFPFEYRLIDYEEGSGLPLKHYQREIQSKPYVYGTHYLPHDSKAHQLATGRSVAELMRSAGFKIQVLADIGVANGINAARMIFERCWFDGERCADGIQGLRHYRWAPIGQLGQVKREPLHDWACFDINTLVLTRYGTHRIIDLPENGEVLTPCGWKPYLGPRITKRNAPLVEVLFADGSTVKCTPDHLFLTVSGWKSAESLIKNTQILSSLTRSRSISMVAYTVCGRVLHTIREAADRFTGLFGNPALGLFRQTATFTIGTGTRTTIIFQTLNVSQKKNTDHSQITSADRAGSMNWHGKKQLNGIIRQPEDYGTAGTQSELRDGRIGNANCGRVTSVVRCLMRSFANLAGRKDSAPQYARPLRIESVTKLAETADVCCIHVQDVECFSLSNGAVVHNSNPADGFRYFAVGIKAPAASPMIKPAAQPRVITAWS